MDIQSLEAEANRLVLPRFNETVALRLGAILIELAAGLGVVINIHNDNWARRKSNTVLVMGRASMLVGLRNAERKRTLATEGLDEANHADHGGAVPVRVTGVGMVAVCTVSGLPQEDDHRLVIKGLEALLAELS